ncbi:MAG: B12-binding domain-containing radical SAM protein [Candidatus Hermodarchaeota archaeon]
MAQIQEVIQTEHNFIPVIPNFLVTKSEIIQYSIVNPKYKRVLLVMPNFRMKEANRFIQRIYPPIGLMYLASYLSDLNVEVEIIDAKYHNLSNNELRNKIKAFNPDLVGISVLVSASINNCNEIAKIVKEVKNDCTVVFGGRHATALTEDTLSFKEVDIVVRGEGELTFRELIINGVGRNVKGISYKKSGKIIHNQDRELMSLDNLKFPARNQIKNNKYKLLGMRIETIQTSRGCPYRCRFCTTPVSNKGSWRSIPVEKIITELRMISQNRKITDIIIVDDNFAVNTRRIEELCSKIIEGKEKGELNDFKFYAQIRVDTILKAPEMVKKMSEAGFWSVLIGVESVNNETLKDMDKKISLRDTLKAIEILHSHNIIVYGSMIIGFDLEASEEDIIKEINFMENVNVDILVLNVLTPYPGTPIFKELDNKNLIVTKDWEKYVPFKPVIRTFQLSSQKLNDLMRYAFKKHAYHKRFRGILERLIATRGIDFILNPFRIISTIVAVLKANISINKYFA